MSSGVSRESLALWLLVGILLLLLVSTPTVSGRRDVVGLPFARAADQLNDEPVAITSEVHAVARTKFDPKVVNTLTQALVIPERAEFHVIDLGLHTGPGI